MKNYKFFCMLLCLCLASVILAGCVAAGAVKPNDSLGNKSEAKKDISKHESSAEISSEITVDVSANESAVVEESVYEWDFQKNFPVYVGELHDDVLDMDFPNYVAGLHSTARLFALSETDVLFHVSITPFAYVEYMLPTLSDELAEEAEQFDQWVQTLGIPLVKEGDAAYRYHADLSFRDIEQLICLAKKAGFDPYVKQCEESICLAEKTNTIVQLPFPKE